MDTHCSRLDELFAFLNGCTDVDKVEEYTAEAEETLGEMKIEIHSISSAPKKKEYMEKMQAAKATIGKYKKQLLTGNVGGTKTLNSNINLQATQEQRQKNSLDVLNGARNQLYETEEVAANTKQNLEIQKEQTKKIKENVQETNSAIGYSNKLINRMSKWYRKVDFVVT